MFSLPRGSPLFLLFSPHPQSGTYLRIKGDLSSKRRFSCEMFAKFVKSATFPETQLTIPGSLTHDWCQATKISLVAQKFSKFLIIYYLYIDLIDILIPVHSLFVSPYYYLCYLFSPTFLFKV